MAIDYTKRPKATPAPAQPALGQPAQNQAAQNPAAQNQAAPARPVSLQKVTLTKAAPSVSLSKQGSASGVLRVNLNWTARPAQQAPQKTGFVARLAGGGSNSSIDLDLACLYEYSDGSKGVVQALGGTFRDTHTLGPDPICRLDGDDRSGTNSGGENLLIDLRHVSAIRRILVFAFIYDGAPNWAAAAAMATLYPVSGPQIEVALDEHDPRSTMCAIAMLENNGGELSVRREVRYIQGGHKTLDKAYGWGMRWEAGRK